MNSWCAFLTHSQSYKACVARTILLDPTALQQTVYTILEEAHSVRGLPLFLLCCGQIRRMVFHRCCLFTATVQCAYRWHKGRQRDWGCVELH